MNTIFRIIAHAVLLSFITSTMACTTCRQLPLQSAADIQAAQFDPAKEYKLEFSNGQFYRMKGNKLTAQNGLLGVQFDGELGYRYYQHDQFKKICAEEKNRGKTIGAIVGGVAGGLAVIGAITFFAVLGALGAAQK